MKKIIIVMAAVVAMACPMFAFNIEIGAKANLGDNIKDGKTVSETIQNIDTSADFQFGGSVYANVSVLGGLGVMVEPTIFQSTVKFNGESFDEVYHYDSLTLDVPVMPWLNLNLFNFASIGVGAGLNFSMDLTNNVDYLTQVANAVQNFDMKNYAWSLVCGADAKIFINKHFGIVASARYIMDITSREVPIVVEAYGATVNTGASYPTIEYARRFLYGGIGVEFKLF